MSYRSTLRDILNKRIRINPRYSMRAFARDIQLSPSRLSDLLNGKQGLSRRKALEVCKLLELSEVETIRFIDSVEALHSKNPEVAHAAVERIASSIPDATELEISTDMVAAISNWYHFAITQLADLRNYEVTPQNIASTLGISPKDADDAMGRLLRLGILSRSSEGVIERNRSLTLSAASPNDQLRELHKQAISLALESANGQTSDNQHFSTVFVSACAEDLPSLKAAVTNFCRYINKQYSDAAEKDSIFCIAIQCFKPTL